MLCVHFITIKHTLEIWNGLATWLFLEVSFKPSLTGQERICYIQQGVNFSLNVGLTLNNLRLTSEIIVNEQPHDRESDCPNARISNNAQLKCQASSLCCHWLVAMRWETVPVESTHAWSGCLEDNNNFKRMLFYYRQKDFMTAKYICNK